jgi:hypothetical protein
MRSTGTGNWASSGTVTRREINRQLPNRPVSCNFVTVQTTITYRQLPGPNLGHPP